MVEINILLTSTLLPPMAGGAEQVVWETAKRLAKMKDVNVHVLTTGKYGSRLEENVMIHSLPYKRPLILYYSTIGKKMMMDLLGEFDFDIIHFHIPLPWGFLLKGYSCKKIVTLHGDETGLLEKSIIKFPIRKMLTNEVIKQSAVVTVPSKYYGNEVKRAYKTKITLLKNGVDTDVFKPNNTIPDNNTILFVGRFKRFKGVCEIISVAKKLPQFNFVFIGRGELGDLINLPNTKNLGFVTLKKLVETYNKATICIFPSHNEQFGLTALEAMACGKPVIVGNGGFSDFVVDKENGLFTPPNNEKQLKNSIMVLMQNEKLRKKLGKNARKTALTYGWDNVVLEYVAVYKKLITGSG